MSVGTLCNREVIVAEVETSIAEAAVLMRRFHVGDVVVVAEGETRRPVGLVTDRDIVVEVMAEGLDPQTVTLADVMTRELQSIAEEADFWDAIDQMRRSGVRRLPVVNEAGGLEGILTLDDALELISEALGGLVGLISRERDQEVSSRAER